MTGPRYDVFIAHSSQDKPHALAFKQALSDAGISSFIDEDMLPGTAWDDAIPAAQKQSRVTAVLISDNTEKAWYAREEIVAAVELCRADERLHQVVPIYLDGDVPAELPYGLKRIVGISLPISGGWSKVSRRIRQLLDALADPSTLAPVAALVPEDTAIKGSELVALSDAIARVVTELGVAPASILLAVDFPMHRAPMGSPTAADYWLSALRSINQGILALGSGRVALRALVHAIRAHAPEAALPAV